ncbi:hypothetical protein GQ607_002372 [Colletotrichum asianum]|uniref:Uncharacterized protein n=1 Tax=Colletotrichum asianum TaxID=702518 RepID=A0A8H3WLZ9_9PEZI|nr:hypothetical protein GQ607_002372 [Colletotrichum asianum]
MSQSPHEWEALCHDLHDVHPDTVVILHETLAFCGRLVDPNGPELCQTIENFNSNLQSISTKNERLDWTRTFAEKSGLCAALVNVHPTGGSDQDEGPDYEDVFETLFREDLSGQQARLKWKRFLDRFETIQLLLPSRSLGMIENSLKVHLPTRTAADVVVFVDEAEELWSPPQTEANTFRFLIWCASKSFHSEKLRE